MKEKTNLPVPVTILVLTLITAVFWIVFEVIRTFIKEPAPSVPKEVLLPLNPTLDTDLLTNLQQRLYLSDQEIGDTSLVITASPTPEPTPVASPEATPTGATESAAATQSATATEGGTLNE